MHGSPVRKLRPHRAEAVPTYQDNLAFMRPAHAEPVETQRPHTGAVMACKDNLAFMRPLQAESMQLIVTSPPYNIGKAYEKRDSLGDYVSQQARVISECVRLLNRRGSLCWQVGNHVQDGEIFPLDMILYPIFASSDSIYATGSFGTSSMAFIARSACPVAMKRFSGSLRPTIISSISIPSAFLPNIPARNILRDRRLDNYRATHLEKIRGTFGFFQT